MSVLYWGAQDWTQHSRYRVEGKKHLPQSAGYDFLNASQEAVELLYHKCTLLAYVQFGVHQEPPGPFLPSCFPAGWPLACTGAADYSSSGAGLCSSLC